MRKRPRHDPTRGRHKRATSPETRTWNAEHLTPARPEWMDATTYVRLCALRDADAAT